MTDLNILTEGSEIADFVSATWRPAGFDKRTGAPVDRQNRPLVNNRDLTNNAFLRREEWEVLDETIVRRVQQRFQIVDALRAAGAVSNTTIAEWMSKWRVASERTEADVNMDFETTREEDRIDYKTYSAPVPIISAAFSIGRRELLTARRLGAGIETVEAQEAGVAVAEKLEDLVINGDTSIVVEGTDIDGLTSITARYSDTAEGDFGTLSNIYPTFRDTLAGMAGDRYFGPFRVYIASNQYYEMLTHYSDGSTQTGLERVLSIPDILSIEPNDLIDDGEFVMVQMTPEVIDLRIAMDVETRRWEHPDGSRMHYVVMMSAVPRIKTDYAGNAGVAHITGC